ncbi:MAG TPA: energy transducer TonB, partial [Sphingomonas sp.]
VKPSYSDFLRYWPEYARLRGVPGLVELACDVPQPGPVKRCTVVSEDPKGMGFGVAAIALSKRFRVRPVVENDRARGDIPVLIPVSFGLRRPPPVPSPK